MARKRPEGTCHICGIFGPLSFEHIPPKSAFNNRPVVSLHFEQAISLGPDDVVKGPQQQKGMGGYTLCERCNNLTGHWYGDKFVAWCYQGMEILERAGGKPTLIYLNYVFPLRVLKQIVTMFLSVNGDTFHNYHPELARFVLSRDARFLPPKYRFFLYYNVEGRQRTVGVAAVANMETGNASLLSEITFPPFGYVMTIDSNPPDGRLVEITHFARYAYEDFSVFSQRLPVLPTHVAFPGDYRTKDEIYRDARITPPEH